MIRVAPWISFCPGLSTRQRSSCARGQSGRWWDKSVAGALWTQSCSQVRSAHGDLMRIHGMCLCINIYIYMDVYVYVCIYIYIHIYTYIQTLCVCMITSWTPIHITHLHFGCVSCSALTGTARQWNRSPVASLAIHCSFPAGRGSIGNPTSRWIWKQGKCNPLFLFMRHAPNPNLEFKYYSHVHFGRSKLCGVST